MFQLNDETVEQVQENQQQSEFTEEQINQLYQIFDSYFTKKSEQVTDTSTQDNLDNQALIIDKLDRVHSDIQYVSNEIYWSIVVSLVILFTFVCYRFLRNFI